MYKSYFKSMSPYDRLMVPSGLIWERHTQAFPVRHTCVYECECQCGMLWVQDKGDCGDVRVSCLISTEIQESTGAEFVLNGFIFPNKMKVF